MPESRSLVCSISIVLPSRMRGGPLSFAAQTGDVMTANNATIITRCFIPTITSRS